jgi:hypothetical protein
MVAFKGWQAVFVVGSVYCMIDYFAVAQDFCDDFFWIDYQLSLLVFMSLKWVLKRSPLRRDHLQLTASFF